MTDINLPSHSWVQAHSNDDHIDSDNNWVLASNNKGKLAEFKRLFTEANLDITIIPQGELGIEDAIEDGLSFVENAIIKARHASRISGLPAIADDSGLCVPALGNAPGIYSARYGGEHGNDANNNAKQCQQGAHPISAQRTQSHNNRFHHLTRIRHHGFFWRR